MSNTRHSYRILVKLEFSREIFKKKKTLKYQISKKIRPVGPGLFYAEKLTDGRTDTRDNSKDRFLQFFLTSLKMLSLGQFDSENRNFDIFLIRIIRNSHF